MSQYLMNIDGSFKITIIFVIFSINYVLYGNREQNNPTVEGLENMVES